METMHCCNEKGSNDADKSPSGYLIHFETSGCCLCQEFLLLFGCIEKVIIP